MNFESAIKTINRDYCNLFYAKYLQGLWKIVAGYRTVPEHIVLMRKQLADWQALNDCSNALCTQSRSQPVTVISYGSLAIPGKCILNPPLDSFGSGCFDRNWWPGNVNEILISSFTR